MQNNTMPIVTLMGIRQLIEDIRQVRLPFHVSYKLDKLYHALDSDTEFYVDKLNGILNQYAEKDEDGKMIVDEESKGISIKAECVAQCQAEVESLNKLTIQAPDITFTPDDLAALHVSVEDLQALSLFISE